MLDPFGGSGTTLVQSLESGMSAAGCDVAAFNCLLMRVKTARYDPEILERAGLRLETTYKRHVNRRTGRRNGEFFEHVLVARPV